ncbi:MULTISPECIES: hypothetical protein [unclassified Nocardia]|uniref:hypothetical protein n=1 Tax=unclassified Nocardia TaxID=2637762 RepID=UPI00278C6C9D|nr:MULTISPECIES: hypothetical protein [unclassified Nocardia]
MATTRVRGTGLGATTLGIGAALVMLAPHAAAEGQGYVAMAASNPKVGCGYAVTSGDLVGGGSSSSNGLPITFYDNGVAIGTDEAGGGLVGKAAKVTWTPETTGQHVLTAIGSWGDDHVITLTPLTVQVAASTATGSFGCPLPSISG